MTFNVLQIVSSFHQGGSERQTVQLARLLKEDGRVSVHLAALSREGLLLEEVESLGLPPIPEFPLSSFYDANFLRQVRRCAAFMRKNGITVVQAHDFYTNVFGMAAAALARVPMRIASKRETGGMRSAAQSAVEKAAFRVAHRIVANSEAVRSHLARAGVAPGKISVIHNGLDAGSFRPVETDRARVCESLGLPPDARLRFVTLVANLRHEVKNVPMFIRAARKVADAIPGVHFVIAGEGELQPGLERFAAESGLSELVHFIGRSTRVPELLSVSYAGVLTSFHEGFSNSIIEYMAAGLPVVATAVGGAEEAVVENETGFLVGSDDDEALAGRLRELLADEARAGNLGKNGRAVAEERFSCRARLERTLALYGIGKDAK